MIRIVDRLILTASGPVPPEQMPAMTVPLTAFVAFKSGLAKGSYTVKLVVKDEQGQPKGPEALLPIFFEGDDRGANLIVNMAFRVEKDGLYWFDVLLNGRLMTRMPLRIVYQRTSLTAG